MITPSLPPSPIEVPEVKLFRALLMQVGLVRRVMTPYFRRFGISGAQWAVLRALARAHRDGLEGLKGSEIGDRLLIRPPSVTGVLDRLEREKLVQRLPSQADRRMKLVSLTTQGRELVEQLEAGHAGHIQQVFAGLSAQEQMELRTLIDKLNQHLTQLADQVEKSTS